MRTSMSTTPTFKTEAPASSCYLTTAVYIDCYSEGMAYTVLRYSQYWASFHGTYGRLHQAMASIDIDHSCHIKVIHIYGDRFWAFLDYFSFFLGYFSIISLISHHYNNTNSPTHAKLCPHKTFNLLQNYTQK